MNVLQLVQEFCRRTNLDVPTSVNGSTEDMIIQIQGLLQEEGHELSERTAWESLTFETTWTSTAAESQGAMTTLAANGFNYIKNNTFWNRTTRLPVIGPVNDVEWQALKAMVATGPRYHYRIRGGLLLLNPTPVAGHTFVFEYVSENWMLGIDGTTYKRFSTLDTDTFLLPDDLLLQGLRWRWKKEKGFTYEEDYNAYEASVKDAIGRSGGKAILSADGCTFPLPRPGIFVPAGSWITP